MCCGSRKDNYYTVTPHRPPSERPHPSVCQSRPQRHQPQPQPQYRPRGPGREELEKRQRQAQATAAARTYGWPTERGMAGNMRGRRDSIIEPDLAGGLAAMPGSDFRAVYDPQRPRHLSQQQRQRQQQQQKQTITPQQRTSPPKWQPQRPPYYQQQFVDQQPGRMPPMKASPSRQAAPSVTRQRPAVGRILPIIPTRPPIQAPPQNRKKKRPVRRDSNGVSECSSSEDDDDDDHRRHRRNYNVSPLHSPERP